MKSRIREISTVILVVLTTIPALAGGHVVGPGSDLPVKFVSRPFGFSAYFCAPVVQTEEKAHQGFVNEGVRYSVRTYGFYALDKKVPWLTTVNKGQVDARVRLADFNRAETNTFFRSVFDGILEELSSGNLVEHELSTFKGYQASKFLITAKNEHGTPFCMTGVVAVVPDKNTFYTVYFMTWGAGCATQDRNTNNQHGQPFLDSFEILK